jgi:hypothetical protein
MGVHSMFEIFEIFIERNGQKYTCCKKIEKRLFTDGENFVKICEKEIVEGIKYVCNRMINQQGLPSSYSVFLDREVMSPLLAKVKCKDKIFSYYIVQGAIL